MKFNNILDIISLIVLTFSFLGILVIVYRKIPILAELQETAKPTHSWKNLSRGILQKLGRIKPVKNFSPELFLHKILSKVRVLVLKIDTKTSSWLHRLRERAKKKKMAQIDNYWQEIRKIRISHRRKKNLPM